MTARCDASAPPCFSFRFLDEKEREKEIPKEGEPKGGERHSFTGWYATANRIDGPRGFEKCDETLPIMFLSILPSRLYSLSFSLLIFVPPPPLFLPSIGERRSVFVNLADEIEDEDASLHEVRSCPGRD